MNIVDRVAAWSLVLLGVLHSVMTTMYYRAWRMDAVWFLSGGIALMLVGMLNLVRIRYAGIAPGTRVASLIANLLTLGLAIAAATLLPLRSNPQVIVLPVVLILETAFSLRHPAGVRP